MAYDGNRIKQDFFNFDGAITKAEYQRGFVILFIIGIILTLPFYIFPIPVIVAYVFLAIRILMLIAMFSITIRRLRGLGMSPWLSLLLLVPLVNLVFAIYLLIIDAKPNI